MRFENIEEFNDELEKLPVEENVTKLCEKFGSAASHTSDKMSSLNS